VKPRQINELYQAAFAELPVGCWLSWIVFSRYLLVLRVCSEPTVQAMVGLKESLYEARAKSQLAENRLISLVPDCGPTVQSSEISKYISGMPFLLISNSTRAFQSLGMVRRLIWTVIDEETSLHPYRDPSEAQHSLERFRHTYKQLADRLLPVSPSSVHNRRS
jgi:hypothetical protein